MLTPMSKLLAIVLAVALLTATIDRAEARWRGQNLALGIAAGIIGLAILNATANARRHGHPPASCYPGPRRCDSTGQRCVFDEYGQQTCDAGEVRCYRPTICP